MGHDHNHNHNHDHNHDHDHEHDHDHKAGHELSDMDKLNRLLDHWQDHNRDHEANYRSWADKAEKAGKGETAALLRQIADITANLTDLFIQAEKTMK